MQIAAYLGIGLIALFVFAVETEEVRHLKKQLDIVNAQMVVLAQENKEEVDRYKQAQMHAVEDIKKSQQNVTYIMQSPVSSDCVKAINWSIGQTKRIK